MTLKTVEEYSQEMTRDEFDRFTEDNELCPKDLGLKNKFDDTKCSVAMCKECYDAALTGIKFKVAVPTLPKETLPVLQKIQELEVQAKKIELQEKALKENLLKAMEKHDIKKWDNEVMIVTYVAPTTRTSIDSKKLKEDMPEVVEKYSKTSNVKSSIRIKLK